MSGWDIWWAANGPTVSIVGALFIIGVVVMAFVEGF